MEDYIIWGISWPYTAPCTHCGGSVQFAMEGNYRCPRCSSFISIDDRGTQTIVNSVDFKTLELNIPSNSNFIAPLNKMILTFVSQAGFSAEEGKKVGKVIDAVMQIVVEKRFDKEEMVQILAVANVSEVIIGIKSLNVLLDKKDSLFTTHAHMLDSIALPSKGQLLKITIKRK